MGDIVRDVQACGVVSSDGGPGIELTVHGKDGSSYTATIPASVDESAIAGGFEQSTKILNDALIGLDAREQDEVDERLKAAEDDISKEGLPDNKCLLAASMALCRMSSERKQCKLYEYIRQMSTSERGEQDVYTIPVPAFSMIKGGDGVENRLAMGDFLLLPTGAESFTEALKIGSDVYNALMLLLEEVYGSGKTIVNIEGAFCPSIDHAGEALELLEEASKRAGHANKIKLGIDVLASSFYSEEFKYYDADYKNEEPIHRFSAHELCLLYESFIRKHNVAVIANPFAREDWPAYIHLTSRVGSDIQVLSGDLIGDSEERLEQAISTSAITGLQLTIDTFKMLQTAWKMVLSAKKGGLSLTLCHNNKDTEDPFLADMAVGLGAGIIKAGAPCRSENLANYNRLVRIERELGSEARYAGSGSLKRKIRKAAKPP